MSGLLIQGEQMGVQQTVPGLVCERGPHPALGHLPLFGLQHGGNDDGIDAILGKSRIPQDALGQVLIVMGNPEAFFDKTVDADGLGRFG